VPWPADCFGPYNCFDPGYDPSAAPGVIGGLSLSEQSYHPAYKAGVGWDFASGLGTVNATRLVFEPDLAVWSGSVDRQGLSNRKLIRGEGTYSRSDVGFCSANTYSLAGAAHCSTKRCQSSRGSGYLVALENSRESGDTIRS
jgi:hypothetical protein